jgi:RHS repeat-associated protein
MRVGGANQQYLQSDQHGTTQVAAAANGTGVTRRDLDPYGNLIGTPQGTWPDNHAFLNKPHSADTGVTDVGARQYDPTTGTFISVDPVLDPSSPSQWNAYGYSNNNPTSMSDPTGLYCDMCDLLTGHQIGVNYPPCGRLVQDADVPGGARQGMGQTAPPY